MDPALSSAITSRTIYPYTGWALDIAMFLDDRVPSFVARSFRWGALKRQAAYYVMAEIASGVPIPELALRFAHQAPFTASDPLTRIGTVLDGLRAREIMRAMIGEVPAGLLGTMERLGVAPMSDPRLYRTLTRLYRPLDQTDRCRTRVLAQLKGALKGGQIEAISVLDPVLLHANILLRTADGAEARKLNLALAYIRSHCSAATDTALRQSIERIPPDLVLRKWVSRWAARFDGLPQSALDLGAEPSLVLIRSGAALVDAGRRYQNCLASKVGEVITGRYAFAEYRSSEAGAPGVLAELRCTSRGFVLDALYAHRNGMVRKDLAATVRTKLARCGVAIRRHAPGHPEAVAATASFLGVYNWHDLDVVSWDEIEEEAA